ncbi:MAG: hypothetical protein ACI4XL_06840, partial [Bacillus sp. (in: firmicutes)]
LVEIQSRQYSLDGRRWRFGVLVFCFLKMKPSTFIWPWIILPLAIELEGFLMNPAEPILFS